MKYIFIIVLFCSQILLANQQTTCLESSSTSVKTSLPQKSIDDVRMDVKNFLQQPYTPETLQELTQKPHLFGLLFKIELFNEAIARLEAIIKPTHENKEFNLPTLMITMVNQSHELRYLGTDHLQWIAPLPIRRASYARAFHNDSKQHLQKFNQIKDVLNYHLGFESLNDPYQLTNDISLDDFSAAAIAFSREIITVADFFAYSAISQIYTSYLTPHTIELEKVWNNENKLSPKEMRDFQLQVAQNLIQHIIRNSSSSKVKLFFQVISALKNYAYHGELVTDRNVKQLINDAKKGKISLVTDILFLERKFEFIRDTTDPQIIQIYQSIDREFKQAYNQDLNQLFPTKITELFVKVRNNFLDQKSLHHQLINEYINGKVNQYRRSLQYRDATQIAKKHQPIIIPKQPSAPHTKKKKKKRTVKTQDNFETPEDFHLASQDDYTIEPATIFYSHQAKTLVKTSGKKRLLLAQEAEKQAQKISQNPLEYGVTKVSLPSFIKVHKFNFSRTQHRLAFIFHGDSNQLEILLVGPRDSFYKNDSFHVLKKMTLK